MINRAFSWASIHKKAIGIFTATCAATVVGLVYTNNYNDHVDRQKEFVLVNEMQDDIQEIKMLQRQNNEMMGSLVQSNMKHEIEIEQIEKRVENLERVNYAPKK